MANIKFSAFTQKVVTGNVDFLVGYTGADNVRISPAIFSDTYLPLAGGVMVGTLNLNDNVKAIWGGGSDLQIYHDGSHSYISEQGTGRLIIKSDYFEIDNAAGTEAMLECIEDGAVNLYYDSSKKFETTATGVTVTGDVIINKDNWLQINTTWGARAAFGGTDDAATFARTIIRSIDNSATSGVDFQNYAGNSIVRILDGGNVGIGSDTPTAKLQLESTSAGAATVAGFLVNSSTTLNTETRLAFAAHTNSDIATDRYSYISTINSTGSNGQDMVFATNATGAGGTEKMRIDSAGNVGIGTSTPLANLDVANTAGTTYQQWSYDNPGANDYNLTLSETVTAGNVRFVFNQRNAGTTYSDVLVFNQGQIGIGTEDPASILHLVSAAATVFRVEETTNNATAAIYATASDLWMGSITNHPLKILTNDVPAITIDTSQNATFAGNVIIHDGSNAPYIDFVEDADTADSKARITMDQVDTDNGQLIFSTENAGTLTNALTINQTGIVQVNPTNASTGGIVNSYRAAISVSTSAIAISNPATYGGLASVWVNSAGNIAHDLVSYSLSGIDVVASQPISGSAAARTYTAVSGVLKVAMAAGTYDVYATEIRVSLT